MPERLLDATELVSTPRPRELPASGRAGWAVVIAAFLAGILAQVGAVALWIPPGQQTTIWLLGGVMLAITLLTEPRRWAVLLSAVTAGQALVLVRVGVAELVPAFLIGGLTALCAVLPASVLRRVAGSPFSLGTIRDFFIYLGVVVVGGSLFASVIFLLGAMWLGYRPPTYLSWRNFTLSTLLGFLIVTPTLLLLAQRREGVQPNGRARRIEAALLGILLVLASSLVFRVSTDSVISWPVFAIALPPLLFWAAIRFSALGASASVLLVTLISTLGTARGLGPFIGQSPAENTRTLQLFMVSTGLPLIGLAVVLGEHRRTMAALWKTHRRLLETHHELLAAREDEQTRIARELHDDVGQRLALVSIGLSRLRHTLPGLHSGGAGTIARLQEQTSSVSRSLRELSHQLHPAALEHVGLAGALQMKCDEVADVTGLHVQLVSEGETTDLPPEIALCLFRVAQEALTNVVRHAGAKRATLVLRRESSAISFQISDDGRGFAAGRLDEQTGLGLHSATERVRLVGGTMTLASVEGAGTTLRVNIPLRGNHGA